SGDGSVVFICARNGGTFKYFVSTDAGASFVTVPSGQLATAIGRAECSVTDVKNSAGYYNIYVSSSTGGGSLNSIRVSEDHGVTFSNIGPGGSTLFMPYSTSQSTQGNYDQTISYIPGKPDECIIGGIDQYHWVKDPGSSPTWGGWTQISLWSAFPTSPTYIHADNHEMKWNSAGQYYYGNDGGVGSAFGTPPGAIFYPANKGYNVTQFYSVAHNRQGHVMGGTQDNGTLFNDFSLSSSLQFQEVRGGDGFDCDISHYDSEALIATIYSSSISRSEDGGNNWQDISPPCIGLTPGLNCGVFHTPVRLFEDPNDMDSQDFIEYYANDSTIPSGTVITYYSKSYNSAIAENILTYTLTSDLYYTDTLLSQDTASNGQFFALHPGTSDTVWMGTDSLVLNYPYDTLQLQDPVQTLMATLDGGGLTITRDAMRFGQSPDWWDLTGATGYPASLGTPYCFEFSWNGDVMFVGTSNGLYRFQGFDSVYDLSDIPLLTVNKIYSSSAPINGIAIDKNNNNRLVVARSGVSGGTGLMELTNVISGGSATATSIQGNISTAMAILDVVIDYRDPQKIIAGTDFGVWATSVGGSNWTQCINETGPVAVFAIRQQQRDWQESSKAGEIYIGTHGRGIWTSSSVLSDGDVEHLVFDENFRTALTVFPNPLDENGKVSFNLNTRSDVKLNIFSINGKLVKTISKSNLGEGKQTIDLSMNGTGKGTYIIQLEAGNYRDVTRFIKLK
ncbi:MAG: T9SS type A sorting domain-containing protein, partial [Flavobacteriales bacterium]|nr:T9SS type A sorting domain-containing protein [Flavobacteriales bacterium]